MKNTKENNVNDQSELLDQFRGGLSLAKRGMQMMLASCAGFSPDNKAFARLWFVQLEKLLERLKQS